MSIQYAVNDHNISLTVLVSLYILHMALALLPTRRGANHIWKHPRIPEFDRSSECCFSPLDTETPPLFSPSGGYRYPVRAIPEVVMGSRGLVTSPPQS